MAIFCSEPIFFFTLVMFFISSIQFIHSLSTVSISQVSNQTLVCALLQSPAQQQSYLNCTSFPDGIRIPVSSSAKSFTGIVGGNGFVCALSSFSVSIMVCWRFDVNGTNMSYKRIYSGPLVNELDSGNSHICGLVNGTNQIQCWQWQEFGSNGNSSITSSLAVGGNFVCGLDKSRQILCLGSDTQVTDHIPRGNYSLVAAGFRHACAISMNGGSIECWGDMDMVGEKAPAGVFTWLALSENRGCGLKLDKTLLCWGENNFSLPVSLKDKHFISIEANQNVFCGILLDDFSLSCWGNDFLELDSNSTVFNYVVPGPCRRQCPCNPLPSYGYYCSQGLMICEPCILEPSTLNPPLAQPPPLPSPPPQRVTNGGDQWDRKMVAFLVVGCFGSVSLALVLCFLFFKYCKIRGCRVHDSGPLEEPTMAAPPPQQQKAVLEKKLSQLVSMGKGGLNLEEFCLESLLKATNGFSKEHKIGTGSFGSVYAGILEDGRKVAIKRAEVSASSSYNIYAGGVGGGTTIRNLQNKDYAFMNELEFLSRLNHRNLVRLLGYCEDCNERVLVYEYIDNGNLHDHLHKLQESSPLRSWAGRVKVALDAARGIEYLHIYAVPQVIHRDIKSSNILLDATWTAKVSDFGLSLMGPEDEESHLSLRAAGTVGYMDPEYYRMQKLTTKSDVYSYGVVLLELLSGCKAIHKNENGVPRNVVDYVVPYIIQDEIHRVLDQKVPPPTPFEIEAVAYVGYLAADCVTLEGRDRPTMTEIVNSLERALAACLASPMLSRSTTTATVSSTIELELNQ